MYAFLLWVFMHVHIKNWKCNTIRLVYFGRNMPIPIVAETLAPCIARTPAALSLQDKRIPIFHGERFPLPVLAENENTFLIFPEKSPKKLVIMRNVPNNFSVAAHSPPWADTRRNNNVIVTSKRRFDVIMTVLLRHVAVGLWFVYAMSILCWCGISPLRSSPEFVCVHRCVTCGNLR